MSVEKSELRAAGMHEVGMRMDDLLEAAKKESIRCEGAVLALLQATKAVADLNAHVDRDLDEGLYDLPIATLIKKYLGRAVQATQNLGLNAANTRMTSAGAVQAYETAVTVTKKMYDGEMLKKAVVAAAEVAPITDIRSRGAGVHPAPTIKKQRLAEEQAKNTVRPVEEEKPKRARRARNA